MSDTEEIVVVMVVFAVLLIGLRPGLRAKEHENDFIPNKFLNMYHSFFKNQINLGLLIYTKRLIRVK